jgi:hypothetical protein
MPLKPSRILEGFFVVNFLKKLIKVRLESGRCLFKHSRKLEGFFFGKFFEKILSTVFYTTCNFSNYLFVFR